MSAVAVAEQFVVETRSGDGFQVADVNFPKRLVTCIAMPYEQPAEIFDGGRVFTEVVSRGAFDGIEKRSGKVRVNRDHSWEKPVGKIVALHPSRKEGLVTEVRISPTPLGDDTLALCDDDVLSASVGFGLLRRDDGRVWDDAEVWERNRTLRRLNRLWLDHLALVPNPAHPGAGMLSVRDASVRPQDRSSRDETTTSTPNLDRYELDALKAEAAAIDRRWPR
jgi:HK97 family phage prohead protease